MNNVLLFFLSRIYSRLTFSDSGTQIDLVDTSIGLTSGQTASYSYPVPMGKVFHLNFIAVSSTEPFKTEAFLDVDPIMTEFGEGGKPGIFRPYSMPKKFAAGESLNFTNTNWVDPNVPTNPASIYTTISGVLYDA